MKRTFEVLAIGALLAAHGCLWIGWPAVRVNEDAFDELMLVESPSPVMLSKHPAAEPAVWGVLRAARALGIAERAIDVVQPWNGLWMTVALAGLCALGVARHRTAAALLAALVTGGSAAGLHLAADPYLFYWPPALGLFAWAAVLAAREARGWPVLSVALVALAAAFNPMMLAGALTVAWIAWRRGRRVLAVAAVALPAASLFLLQRLAVPSGMQVGSFHGVLLPYHGLHVLGGFVASFATAGMPQTGVPPEVALRLALSGVGVGVLAGGFALLARSREARSTPSDAWGAWLGAAAVLVFVAWWNPEQLIFYLGAVWLAATAVLLSPVPVRAPLLGWLIAVPLVAYNIAHQTLPARGPDRSRAVAADVARTFGASDLLLFLDEPMTSVEYRTGVATRSLSATVADRPAGRSTLDVLRADVADRAATGGGVWLEVADDDRPRFPEWMRERLAMDLTEEDLVPWLAERARAGHLRFRRLVGDRGPGFRARVATNASAPIPLADFGWHTAVNGYGPVEIDRANGEPQLGDGGPLSLRGRVFERGVGTHAPSFIRVRTGGACRRFRAWAGVDDAGGELSSLFMIVRGDARVLLRSPLLSRDHRGMRVDLPIDGVEWLELQVDAGPGGNNWEDLADWAEAELVCDSLP